MSQLKKRNLKVNIILDPKLSFGAGNIKIIENLAMTVEVNYVSLPDLNTATIEILNMLPEDREILNFSEVPIDEVYNNKIEIYAGYNEQSHKVFSGEIMEIDEFYGLDTRLVIQAQSNYLAQVDIAQNQSLKGNVNVGELFQILCVANGYILENINVRNKIVTDPVLVGSVISQLNALAEMSEIDLHILDKTVIIRDNTLKILEPVYMVNTNNGLIGFPQISSMGISFEVLFEKVFKINDIVFVDCDNKKARNKWKIFEVSLRLQNYGNDWIQEIHGEFYSK